MSKISPYDILYEDDEILTVYKQRDVFSIRTKDKKTFSHNLYHYLYLYLKQKGEKLYIVHRLDYETSGILIFAKNEKMKQILQKAFENREVTRLYECVVKEDVEEGKQFTVRQYLSSGENGTKVIETTPEEGKEAITHFRAENKIQIGRVLSVQIETGRRNQIRLALQSLHLTLIGDKRYAKDEAKRMYLNAYSLSFLENIPIKEHSFSVQPLWLISKK